MNFINALMNFGLSWPLPTRWNIHSTVAKSWIYLPWSQGHHYDTRNCGKFVNITRDHRYIIIVTCDCGKFVNISHDHGNVIIAIDNLGEITIVTCNPSKLLNLENKNAALVWKNIIVQNIALLFCLQPLTTSYSA